MGAPRENALSAVRVSFSPQNTFEEVDAFTSELGKVIREYL
jgi:cysteine sulfinate desulfinase/cysteine desulfurase-like protein